VTFAVAGEAYDRFIGRYSRVLAPLFLDFAGVGSGPVVEVGCGPGALTEVLADRLGAGRVAAVDPSAPSVATCRARVPGADVRVARAEALPFASGSFTAALSQLVLSFVADPDRAMAEAARVVRPRGMVAACTFEASGFDLVRAFWEAALRFDPAAPDDDRLPFRRPQELAHLWGRSGFQEVESAVIDLEGRYEGFDDCWGPFAFGIGPTGEYLAGQPEERRARIREACFEILGRPAGAFSLPARVIAIRGRT
jgi:SAM-dependent methyltransferase